VAICAWLVPGAGYALLGEAGRALTVGITILLLFVLGLLIGGVRVLEVPGYDAVGKPVIAPAEQGGGGHWIMAVAPFTEIRNKPWSVPQVLTGPVSIAAAVWSVQASRPDPANDNKPHADLSHSRVNEIGSLYLSVAGLLNLMAIIDAAYRAAQRSSSTSSAGAAA
jgi:hypothetical protein